VNKRIRQVACIVVLSLLVFTLGFSTHAAPKKIVIKITGTENAESNTFKVIEHMAALVADRTDNQVVFETYPSGVLSNGKVSTMVEQAQMGSIEALCLSTLQVTNWLPELSIICLPLLFDNIDESYKLANSPAGGQILAKYDNMGLVGAAAWTRNLRQFIHGKKALVSPEDFKGQRMRVPEIKMFVSFFDKLGAVVTPMTWGEVFTALQLGSIEGLEQPTETIYPEKLYEVQKYLTVSDYAGDWMVISYSKKFWNSLTPEIQGILKEAAIEAGEYKYQMDKEATEQDLKRLADKGMIIIRPTEEQKAAFKPYAEAVWAEFEGVVGKDLLAAVRAELGK